MSMNVEGLHVAPGLHLGILFRRRLPRMKFAALLAFSQIGVSVEKLEHGRQIADDTFQIDFRSKDKMMALRAVPFDAVHSAFRSRRFDHQSDASRDRCGEWRTCLGSRNISPSLMG